MRCRSSAATRSRGRSTRSPSGSSSSSPPATGIRPTTARSWASRWTPRSGRASTRPASGPSHCVQGTPGAELHPSLDRSKVDVVVDKAQDPNTQGYSAFHGGNLADVLRERGVDHVYVAGLATDYCVKNTVLDAVELGFGVTVVEDAVRGIEVEPGDIERGQGGDARRGRRLHHVARAARRPAQRSRRRAAGLRPRRVRVPPLLRRDLGLDVDVLGLLERLESLLAQLAPDARLLHPAERPRVVVGQRVVEPHRAGLDLAHAAHDVLAGRACRRWRPGRSGSSSQARSPRRGSTPARSARPGPNVSSRSSSVSSGAPVTTAGAKKWPALPSRVRPAGEQRGPGADRALDLGCDLVALRARTPSARCRCRGRAGRRAPGSRCSRRTRARSRRTRRASRRSAPPTCRPGPRSGRRPRRRPSRRPRSRRPRRSRR